MPSRQSMLAAPRRRLTPWVLTGALLAVALGVLVMVARAGTGSPTATIPTATASAAVTPATSPAPPTATSPAPPTATETVTVVATEQARPQGCPAEPVPDIVSQRDWEQTDPSLRPCAVDRRTVRPELSPTSSPGLLQRLLGGGS
jgi:hypothetical protein